VRVELLLQGIAVAGAAAVIEASADDEQRMNPSVAGSVGSEFEPRLTDGPFALMNAGTTLRAPKAVAAATWGFTAGKFLR